MTSLNDEDTFEPFWAALIELARNDKDWDEYLRLLRLGCQAGDRPLIRVTEPAEPNVVATYRAQNDNAYARYERMNPSVGYRWRVRTLDGRIYYSGDATRSHRERVRRIDHLLEKQQE